MKACVLNTCSMQSNSLQAENATLRGQIEEHQAHAAALQDQSAEQSRTISLGSLQLKQLQSKVRQNCIRVFPLYIISIYTVLCLLCTHEPGPQGCYVAPHGRKTCRIAQTDRRLAGTSWLKFLSSIKYRQNGLTVVICMLRDMTGFAACL